MKLCKNVKIYGIERIVFDKTTIYELHHKNTAYPGLWCRVESPRNKKTDIGLIVHQQMAKNINAICNTSEYDVGINGNTIHVDTLTPKRRVCICGISFEYPTNHVILCDRHGD